MNGVQNLEYRTGCLKLSVSFPTCDYKNGLTVHRASHILAMCGKFNGCCYVYDVQHLEYHTGCNCLKPGLPFLQDIQHGVLECMVLMTSCGKLNGYCFVYDVQHLESVAFLNRMPL